MMAIDFPSALLVTAFALILCAVSGAIVWGVTALLPRLAKGSAQPRVVIGEREATKAEVETHSSAVTAQHAGTILKVAVQPGQAIQFAQELFTMDTGKQVIVIRAARMGIAGEVQVSEGEVVHAGQILMEFSEPESSML